jgi:hypothetical protein
MLRCTVRWSRISPRISCQPASQPARPPKGTAGTRSGQPVNDSVWRHLGLCGPHQTEMTGALAGRTFTAPPTTFGIDGKAKQHQYSYFTVSAQTLKQTPGLQWNASFHYCIHSIQPFLYTPIQSKRNHPILTSILILSLHLRTDFTSGLFFQGVSCPKLISISDIIPACRMHHVFHPLSIHHLSSVLYTKPRNFQLHTLLHPCYCFFPASPDTPPPPSTCHQTVSVYGNALT